MQDARYFRDQAQVYLQLANLMSDPAAASRFRAAAAEYFAKATDLEKQEKQSGDAGGGSESHTTAK